MALLMLGSCVKDPGMEVPDTPVAPEFISVNPASLTASALGYSYEITITAPVRPKLSGLPDWISLSDGVYKDFSIRLGLTLSANPHPEERSATLTISAAGATDISLVVTQDAPGKDPSVWESAAAAVRNMGAGWNLGNTLDSNSGDVQNMWIEAYTSRTPADYETAWGQPQTSRELIHMFKEAGFGAIRVPVTWYPHMGTVETGYEVDSAWIARVKEVVDYVIDEDMYCILNVHHDTGAASTAWLVAGESEFNAVKDRYEALWEQIATTFMDYGQKLLFESYNEMLDPLDSWCFASFAASGGYDAGVAASAYSAINSYAVHFSQTVRATGGNNAHRNLIVNTYGACSGDGTWNSHLQEPLSQMQIPESPGHIAVEVHSYWDAEKFDSQKADIDQLFTNLNEYIVKRLGVPAIIGEWGGGSNNDNAANTRFATYFSGKAKEAGVAAFWWMGLSDGKDRSVPTWTMPKTKDAILEAYK